MTTKWQPNAWQASSMGRAVRRPSDDWASRKWGLPPLPPSEELRGRHRWWGAELSTPQPAPRGASPQVRSWLELRTSRAPLRAVRGSNLYFLEIFWRCSIFELFLTKYFGRGSIFLKIHGLSLCWCPCWEQLKKNTICLFVDVPVGGKFCLNTRFVFFSMSLPGAFCFFGKSCFCYF